MMVFDNPVQIVQEAIANELRKEPWFSAHNVKIIEQNSQELSFLLRTRLDELRGVSLIVGVDGAENNQPCYEMNITISCSERVTINRAKQGFATAIDACFAAVKIVDGLSFKGLSSVWHFKQMNHEASKEIDLLRATATFGGQVYRRDFYSREEH